MLNTMVPSCQKTIESCEDVMNGCANLLDTIRKHTGVETLTSSRQILSHVADRKCEFGHMEKDKSEQKYCKW